MQQLFLKQNKTTISQTFFGTMRASKVKYSFFIFSFILFNKIILYFKIIRKDFA